MTHKLDIKAGQRFGRLTVIKEVAQLKGRRRFKFTCDCGKTASTELIHVTTGKTRSCGCLFRESLSNARTHGMSKTPTYSVWCDMRKRCENSRNKSYPDYGGRGIKVCKRWHKFENFFADMGERPSAKHELDRFNGNDDYKPGNVRWSNNGGLQARNRRKQKNASSQFRGVDWWNGRAWRARIHVRNKTRDLGLFKDEHDAARAYDAVARKLKGFRLNFPKCKTGENANDRH
jgi:hypothetical protein